MDVTLIEGGAGIFELRQNGALLWEKTEHGVFPTVGEAAALLASS